MPTPIKKKKVKEVEFRPKHEHCFKINRALYKDGWVTGLDLECIVDDCGMNIFVEGDFSWHRGAGQRMLHVNDLDRITEPLNG